MFRLFLRTFAVPCLAFLAGSFLAFKAATVPLPLFGVIWCALLALAFLVGALVTLIEALWAWRIAKAHAAMWDAAITACNYGRGPVWSVAVQTAYNRKAEIAAGYYRQLIEG